MRVRNMGELGLTSRLVGYGIEGEALLRFDSNSGYDDSGMTIGQRFDELNALGRDTRKYASIYRAVLDPKTSSKSRTQFFARARADGEIAALQWFAEQQTAPK